MAWRFTAAAFAASIVAACAHSPREACNGYGLSDADQPAWAQCIQAETIADQQRRQNAANALAVQSAAYQQQLHSQPYSYAYQQRR